MIPTVNVILCCSVFLKLAKLVKSNNENRERQAVSSEFLMFGISLSPLVLFVKWIHLLSLTISLHLTLPFHYPPPPAEHQSSVEASQGAGDALICCCSSVFCSEGSELVGTDHSVLRYVRTSFPIIPLCLWVPAAACYFCVNMFQTVWGESCVRLLCRKVLKEKTHLWSTDWCSTTPRCGKVMTHRC